MVHWLPHPTIALFISITHTYHTEDFEYIGRQGLLDEIVWDEETLWPKLINGDTPSIKAEVPFPNTTQQRESIFRDEFEDNSQAYRWQWSVHSKKPIIQYRHGDLYLSNENDELAFIGLRPKTGNYTFTVGLSNQANPAKGIAVYGNPGNRLAFIKTSDQIIIYKLEAGDKTILATVKSAPEGPVHFRITAENGRHFQFFYSLNEKDWLPVKLADDYSVDGHFLPAWDTAPRMGLIVESNQETAGTFSDLEINYEF